LVPLPPSLPSLPPLAPDACPCLCACRRRGKKGALNDVAMKAYKLREMQASERAERERCVSRTLPHSCVLHDRHAAPVAGLALYRYRHYVERHTNALSAADFARTTSAGSAKDIGQSLEAFLMSSGVTAEVRVRGVCYP
jgi:hypothetical protein